LTNLENSIIDNHAVTDHPIHDLLRKRWSARAFSSRRVEKTKLFSILEAARWTPSSRNEQPWRYIIFTTDNPSRLLEAQSVLLESNSFAKQAPILICAITKKTYTDSLELNRLYFHDLGAANENMFLECFNQGLIMHEMGGFNVKLAKEIFNIPDDYEVGIMIAVGYQGTNDSLPEKFKVKNTKPRERKHLSQIAFLEDLGQGIQKTLNEE
jgi:nitroreductase